MGRAYLNLGKIKEENEYRNESCSNPELFKHHLWLNVLQYPYSIVSSCATVYGMQVKSFTKLI